MGLAFKDIEALVSDIPTFPDTLKTRTVYDEIQINALADFLREKWAMCQSHNQRQFYTTASPTAEPRALIQLAKQLTQTHLRPLSYLHLLMPTVTNHVDLVTQEPFSDSDQTTDLFYLDTGNGKPILVRSQDLVTRFNDYKCFVSLDSDTPLPQHVITELLEQLHAQLPETFERIQLDCQKLVNQYACVPDSLLSALIDTLAFEETFESKFMAWQTFYQHYTTVSEAIATLILPNDLNIEQTIRPVINEQSGVCIGAVMNQIRTGLVGLQQQRTQRRLHDTQANKENTTHNLFKAAPNPKQHLDSDASPGSVALPH